MISSMVLFFSRDCAGGAGPTVDAPRPVFSPAVAVFASEAVVVVVGAPAVAVVVAGVDVVAGADVVVADFPIFANMLLPEVAAVVAGSAAVDFPRENIPPAGAGVVADSVAVDLAALGNKEPPAVAGFAVESVAVLFPMVGNRLGVEVEVEVDVVVSAGLLKENKLPPAAGVVEPAVVVSEAFGVEPMLGNKGF